MVKLLTAHVVVSGASDRRQGGKLRLLGVSLG